MISKGALSGVTVIDLTAMLAGPYATMMLADQGATVIKVEPPAGDLARLTPVYHKDDTEKSLSGYFQSTNRNKRSVVLDLKQACDKHVLLDMVAKADVVVQNFRVGTMERLGLGYDVLKQTNPKIVYAALSGFGQMGDNQSPLTHWPAFDVIAQAMGGIMGITGQKGGEPTKVGPGVGDIVPAMHLAFGITAALVQAEKTGQGQAIDVAMTDSILAVTERIIFQQDYQGLNPKPGGNHHPFNVPFGTYPAADGDIALAAFLDEPYTVMCRKLDADHLVDDPRFENFKTRTAHKDELIELIGAVTQQFTKAELSQRLGGLVPFGPVLSAEEIVDHEHFVARNMIYEVEQPGMDRAMKIAGTPVKMNDSSFEGWHRAPLLGEHTESVLQEFGIEQEKIDRVLKGQK